MKKVLFTTIAIAFAIIIHAQNWSVLTTNSISNLKGIYFPTATTGYAVGDNGTILKTTSGGNQWTSLTTAFPGYWFWDVHFVNADTGFVVGESDPGFNPCGLGIIIKTVNGGANWTTLLSGSSTPYRDLFVIDKDTLFACGGAEQTYTQILRSFDGGTTLTPIGTPELDAIVGGMYFLNSNKGFLGQYIFTYLASYLNTTNGTSFSNFLIPSSGGYWNFASDFPKSTIGYFVRSTYTGTDLVYVRKTIDGGNTWNESAIPSFTGSIYGMDFIDETTGYIVGGAGVISNTTDGGATWNAQTSPTANELRSVCFVNPLLGYAAGANGTIIKYVVYTGIPEPDATSLSMAVYPVPASESITVEWAALPKDVSIYIYNIHGQLVLQSDMQAIKTEIDISTLRRGLYLLKAETSVGNVIKRFIKE
jgi:hypothetical protein